jgi:hypothetical protein
LISSDQAMQDLLVSNQDMANRIAS